MADELKSALFDMGFTYQELIHITSAGRPARASRGIRSIGSDGQSLIRLKLTLALAEQIRELCGEISIRPFFMEPARALGGKTPLEALAEPRLNAQTLASLPERYAHFNARKANKRRHMTSGRKPGAYFDDEAVLAELREGIKNLQSCGVSLAKLAPLVPHAKSNVAAGNTLGNFVRGQTRSIQLLLAQRLMAVCEVATRLADYYRPSQIGLLMRGGVRSQRSTPPINPIITIVAQADNPQEAAREVTERLIELSGQIVVL